MLEILKEILDLGKLNSGNLELEIQPVSPYQILDDIRHQMTDRAEEKGLSLVMDYAGN